MARLRRSRIRVAVASVLCASVPAHAQITTDGTVGAIRSFNGLNAAIPASVGQQAGGNLFHSFDVFNVRTGGSAIFTGPSSVANIISRVTGAQFSSIDGRLGSSIPGANLFLINPRGILFGPNASLDLTGSFHASTANYLKFADGTRFEATATANPILTSAPPAAFGFLGPSAAPINAQGAFLAPEPGVSISLVGGPVTLANSVLYATAGDVRIAAVGGTGEVPLNGVPNPSLSRAPVTIQGGGVVTESTMTAPPGRIVIQGGALKFIDTSVISNNFSPGAAPPIELVGAGDLLFRGGQLLSVTHLAGRGADIVTRGKNVTIDRAAWVQATTLGSGRAGDVDVGARNTLLIAEAPTDPDRTVVAAQTEGPGDGGDLRLSGDTVRIDGAYVRNRTFRSGNNGTLVIEGRNVELVGGASVAAETVAGSSGSSGGTRVRAAERILVAGYNAFGEQTYFFTSTDGTGQGGAMLLQAPEVRVSGGIVDTVTEGSGSGAPLTIEAETVRVEASDPFVGVISSLSGTAATGRAGTLTVRASRSLTMGGVGIFTKAHAYQPATILTQNVGAGLGGDIVVESPQITLDTGWIVAEGYGSGDLGSVTVRTHDLTMLRDAAVRSTRAPGATGRSGNVRIEGTGSLTLGARSATTGTPSEAAGGRASILTTDGGNTPAGSIAIDMPEVYVGPDSSITTAGTGAGGSGNISIAAQRLKVVNGLIVSQTGSGVPTTDPGAAGAIAIEAAESIEMTTLGAIPTTAGGVLSSTAAGRGAAGNVRLSAPAILLDGFLVQAATLGEGSGGRVDVRANALALRNGAQISTGTEPGSSGSAGSLNVDVAGRLEIGGVRADGIPSGLSATTRGTGPGGDISVRAGSTAIDGRGFVIASTEGEGPAGSIGIQANDILLTNGAAIRARSLGTGAAGSIRIAANDALRLFGGAEIDSQALASDGGNIDIRVGNLVHLKRSEITTAVGSGQGAGGNIFIDPTFVILEDGSRIVANAFGGSGGNIRIIATYFLNTLDTLVDASSQLGVPGTVEISSPNTNLSTQLKVLPAALFDASALMREACATRYASGRGTSSLVGVGRGGLAASPERFATSTYFGAAPGAAANAAGAAGLKLVGTTRTSLRNPCAG